MSWLIERKIQRILNKSAKEREITEKGTRCRVMMANKTPGAVKLLEELIKLAKKQKYERTLIKELEATLRNYKLDTPKQNW